MFFISFLAFFMLNSCTHTPQKIETYVKKYCNFKANDTCFIDLRKILKLDYDTMYVFGSLTPLTGVRNIIGINEYGKSKNPKIDLIGYDSDMCRIILIKNGKVVYEDEYHYRNYRTRLLYENFHIVKGQGIFDGNSIDVKGYICTNHIFKVTKHGNKYYRVEGCGGIENVIRD